MLPLTCKKQPSILWLATTSNNGFMVVVVVVVVTMLIKNTTTTSSITNYYHHYNYRLISGLNNSYKDQHRKKISSKSIALQWWTPLGNWSVFCRICTHWLHLTKDLLVECTTYSRVGNVCFTTVLQVTVICVDSFQTSN